MKRWLAVLSILGFAALGASGCNSALADQLVPQPSAEVAPCPMTNSGLCGLHGKVKIVSSFPKYKIQIVNSFPDIKVKKVTSFPNHGGEWQFVDSFPDFTVQIVNSFPDIKVQYVDSFPGC